MWYLGNMRAMLCWAVVGVLMVACGEDETAATATENPEPEVETEAVPDPGADQAEVTPIGDLMRGHFVRARDARDAMVSGDLDVAGRHMAWLATHQRADDLPENLRPLLTEMQTEAGHFADAETLTEAGTALAQTLTRCGNCHRAAEAGPEIATPPMPEGDDLAAHMLRHQWAADRMWAGLVTDSEETYVSGARILREASLHEGELPGSDDHPPERITAITTHVHELGFNAEQAEDWAERANIYGRLLATCAACHRLLDGGPAGPTTEGDTPPEPSE